VNEPPLTLLEAQTLAILSLGGTSQPAWWNATARVRSSACKRLQSKGFITGTLERGRDGRVTWMMTAEGGRALRSTWEWLLLQATRQETFYERADRQTREKYDGPDGETR
jgi:DNA-binding PadR family transcriptional regulator